ncbi:hypothetical protein GN241_13255 [Rhodobacteraceae bacterium IMCC1335]
MSRYVFYDFETTGISPAFDHPLQFAAIVTDEHLYIRAVFDFQSR